MAYAKLKTHGYTKGSDILHVTAVVDDAVQVAPATAYDPPEFGAALCETWILWDQPLTHENAPTTEQLSRMLPFIDDWKAIEFGGFDDD